MARLTLSSLRCLRPRPGPRMERVAPCHFDAASPMNPCSQSINNSIEISVPFWAVLTHSLPQHIPMRMNDMSPELFLSVRCPMCKVPSGKRCLLLSGGLRTESHIDRKLAAIEAVETKRIHLVRVQSSG